MEFISYSLYERKDNWILNYLNGDDAIWITDNRLDRSFDGLDFGNFNKEIKPQIMEFLLYV